MQDGVSIGIAIYPKDGSEIDKLMNAADTAMYDSKSHGKNCFTFFNETSNFKMQVEEWIQLDPTHWLDATEIDTQHENIVGMLNKLNVSVSKGVPAENNSNLLDQLYSYTKFHFDSEGKLMDKYEYPETFDHKRTHEALLNDLSFLKKKIFGRW